MYPKTLRRMHACPYVYIRYCTLCTYQPPLPAPKKREKSLLLLPDTPVPRTRIGGSPRTRGPAPAHPPAQPTHTPTHTPAHTREQKLNSTFHFPLSLLYRYLPTTGYKYVYSDFGTVVKLLTKIQYSTGYLPTLGPYITTLLPTLIIIITDSM